MRIGAVHAAVQVADGASRGLVWVVILGALAVVAGMVLLQRKRPRD